MIHNNRAWSGFFSSATKYAGVSLLPEKFVSSTRRRAWQTLCTTDANAFERIESFPVRACPRKAETTPRVNFNAFVRDPSSDPSATEIVYGPYDHSNGASGVVLPDGNDPNRN